MIVRGVGPDSLASVVGEERAMDGLKRRAHDSSRAMDGEVRFSLARLSGCASIATGIAFPICDSGHFWELIFAAANPMLSQSVLRDVTTCAQTS